MLQYEYLLRKSGADTAKNGLTYPRHFTFGGELLFFLQVRIVTPRASAVDTLRAPLRQLCSQPADSASVYTKNV